MGPRRHDWLKFERRMPRLDRSSGATLDYTAEFPTLSVVTIATHHRFQTTGNCTSLSLRFLALIGHSLAIMLDSLVRVSRRGNEVRYKATTTFGNTKSTAFH